MFQFLFYFFFPFYFCFQLDVPAIISSDKIAYLDPQETLWQGQSGRYFKLSDSRTRQCLSPFHGIADFNFNTSTSYHQTLFRFPLRTAASDLSGNLYTLDKVLELIEALKVEAKLLLIFLRSVTCIEVFDINVQGGHTLLFQTKITDEFVADLTKRRSDLVATVKRSHQQNGYNISSVCSFTARFDVCTYDQRNGSKSAQWLVANQVGSPDSSVLTASVKQKVFPWVGTALELNSVCMGRIFCFLPMPVDTSSNFPVHINGTFGLTDDRRSLKWPSVERRNDPTADWNTLLVNKVLPSCYVNLLLEAKTYLSKEKYYSNWPDAVTLKGSHWAGILTAFFTSFLKNQVIWCDNSSQWLMHTNVVYIPQAGLQDVVINVLTACGVQLANITNTVRRAFQFLGVSIVEVNPSYVRNKIRSNYSCVRRLNVHEKYELLKYCWSDGNYRDFDQIELLPLANGTFISFQKVQYYYGLNNQNNVYLCSKEYPRELLPNLDHKLVDIADAEIQRGLQCIGQTGQTQLTNLTVQHVANLIDECMPAKWRSASVITFTGHEQFPRDWFEKFWKWVSNKQLDLFVNKSIVPAQMAGQSTSTSFYVVKLNNAGTTLYFPYHQAVSDEVLSSIQKFGINCALQAKFPYLSHSRLSTYIENFSGRSFLNCLARCSNRSYVTLTTEEAKALQNLLSSTISRNDYTVIRSIKMFVSAANTSAKLYSIDEIISQSLFREVVIEPPNLSELVKHLPPSIILLSTDYIQTQLLNRLGIVQKSDSVFVESCLFPKIRNGIIGDYYIDSIMESILNSYAFLRSQSYTISESIKTIRFLKNSANVRHYPTDLFNPSSTVLSQLYLGENVFPASNYKKFISVLMQCGLKNSVTTQEILNIVFSISITATQLPQPVSLVKIARAKAILDYIQTYEFQQKKAGSFSVDWSIGRGCFPFDTALLLISERRSWLPVCAKAPPGYPSCLPWKGSGYTSHFMSLKYDNACVSCTSREALAYTYGSRVFFSDPPVSINVYQWLGSPEPTVHLCSHLSDIISVKNEMNSDALLDIVCKVYSAMTTVMSTADKHHLESLRTMKEWIYIQKYNKFVNVKSIARNENQNFRHSVDPYLHVLPDSISRYSSLFLNFGMNQSITRSQIISILDTIRSQVSNNLCSSDPGQVWNMVMAILNWLTKDGSENFSDNSILVPAESSSELPALQSSDTLVYTDNEFLRTFISTTDADSNLVFAHSRISPSLAKCLGVTPLSEEMDVSEDTFSDAGQYEPLTVRLKNILKDYKDGVTIIKELIQNADDAEATEVNICYDARQHDIDRKRLFFPGMSDSHGPALIFHNNSTFTDDDFENIQKLAAATKANKQLKIGKFGIGFCSVYHITDVPSFLSRDRMYIFDPTLKHIRKEVKNLSQPGKRIMFLKNVIQKSHQLAPFEGVFNFDKTSSFEGTMFRLPCRSSPSELSSTCYSPSHINELFEGIKESGEKLLLFLQHVQKITIQRIDSNDVHPTIVHQMYKTSNSCISLDSHYFTAAVNINTEDLRANGTRVSTWLIASASSKHNNKDALAAVACELSPSHEYDSAYNVNHDFKGEIFCFLPLSQTTGLPVHVSCNFAVINNRRGIWTTAEAKSTYDPEVQWNIFLMNNVIPTAYINLLHSLRDLHKESKLQEYKFHYLWPLLDQMQMKNPWEHFITEFYKFICAKDLFYSESTLRWMNRSYSKFLLENILCNSGFLDCVINVLDHLGLPVIQLPNKYFNNLPVTSADMNENNFVQVFFKKIEELNDEDILDSRNAVLKSMLETYANPYNSTSDTVIVIKRSFETNPCIPCRPDQSVLRKCSELVHRDAPFAALFDESDHRFPIDLLVDNHMTIEGLKKGGILCQHLPWELVIERAQTILTIYKENREKALKRANLLIQILSDHVHDCNYYAQPALSTIPFLPVMSKPSDYYLKWDGESHDLRCGQEMLLANRTSSTTYYPLIAGSQLCFVNESSITSGGCGKINDKARGYLSLQEAPTMQNVLDHLKLLYQNSDVIVDKEWITKSCTMIYEFMNNSLHDTSNQKIIIHMKTFPSLWNGQKFIKTVDIANNWRLGNGPFLYSVPETMANKHKLLQCLSIKDKFYVDDVIKALTQMKDLFQNKPIDEDCKRVLTDILSVFEESISNSDFKTYIDNQQIFLPNERFILYESSKLAYHDAGWAPKDTTTYMYVYDGISRNMAELLGVRMVRSKLLEPFVSDKEVYFPGLPFGQREDLTRRIQNILRDYPYDITVLKELLQNADDAKAKKLYFILDKRKHGTKSLISENWQHLQGPALLVWNDSVFSEKDLKGIQELGLGSKRSESETIGQYGIGFNVVYHLTDCPSFVTGRETLCIMDPHCAYADGATSQCPGRRYDNLSDRGFWNKFKDMSSSYLLSGLDNISEELHEGSLFRFPLRHTEQLVATSKILDHENANLKPMTAQILDDELKKWIPEMKSAMFFLNNVKEIKYIVIDTASTLMTTIYHFTRSIPNSADIEKSLLRYQESVSNIHYSSLSIPDSTLYPLLIKDHTMTNNAEETWLIQQGVGDLNNNKVDWQYLRTVKPKHGIAAPLRVSLNTEKSSRQLFCFLPLPVCSDLPVHVNGSFILNSTRRDLWSSTTPGVEDDRTRWNNNLFDAIASSYAHFLAQSKSYYIKETYQNWKTALDDLHKYCKLFPSEKCSQVKTNKKMKNVFKILVEKNATILCIFLSKEKTGLSKLSTEWQSVNTAQEENRVYFWGNVENKKLIHPILECIGMKITATSNEIRVSLNSFIKDTNKQLPSVSSETVFNYYTTLSCCSFNKGMKASHISNTVFKNLETFVLFVKFLLKLPITNTEHQVKVCKFLGGFQRQDSDSYTGCFPCNPVSHYLLVSADCILKQFHQTNKILSSDYSELFIDDLDKFLHPSLKYLNLSQSYFIMNLNDEENRQCAIDLIVQIFKNALPSVMSEKCVIDEASVVIDKQRLFEYWDVFNKDSVIKSYLPHVLENIALLCTVDDKLYSLRSKIIPMYLPKGKVSSEARNAVEVLKKLKLPFLDESVVTVQVSCPNFVDDADRVLQNIVEKNKTDSLTSVLQNKDINVLICFFAKHVKVTDCMQSIKCLPLFEDVTGQYQVIQHCSTYIWPNSCSNGYESWTAGYQVNFLKCDGHWTNLGSSQQFSIENLSELGLYINFIFRNPHFGLMSETDRYAHLEYIRDNLFSNVQTHRFSQVEKQMNHQSQKIYESGKFYNKLLTLQCIGPANTVLQPIRAFSDHTQEVFKTFPEDFKTLPENFQDTIWLRFFRKLNLKQSLTSAEYIKFCRKVADRGVNNIAKASEVLVEFLLEFEKTYGEPTLREISTIKFLCAKKPSQVSWLLPPHTPTNQLVSMNGSALLCLQHQLWTVRPLITLPDYSESLRDKLGVISHANETDVVSNIKNISNTCYSSDSLFSNYPQNLKPSADDHTSNLIDIMRRNFECLLSSSNVSNLKILPCIPVYTEKQSYDKSQVALVKPNSVIKSHLKSDPYHPYIYGLPTQFYAKFDFLESIGVSSEITVSHMQIVLERIYLRSDGKPITVNTQKVVQLVLGNLKDQLNLEKCRLNPDKTAYDLMPLYLPDVDNILQLSTTLLYADSNSYYGPLKLNLQGTGKFHFDPKSKYDIYSSEICRLLPERVRPSRLSQYCIQVPNDTCEVTKHSDFAKSFQNSFSDRRCPENFKNAITRFVTEQKKDNLIVEGITKLFRSMTVTTIKKLHATIKIIDTDTEIGKIAVNYIFDKSNHHLYLKDKIMFMYKDQVCSEIACYTLEVIAPLLNEPLKHSIAKNLTNFWGFFLIASTDDKFAMLEDLQITGTVDVDSDSPDLCQLGVEIPTYWQDRLDQDVNNIYNPMEIVGYEIEENKIIIAQIVYSIPSKQPQSYFYRKYKIYINENDEDGIEVSILKLYKFLEGDKKPPVTATHVKNESGTLVLRDVDDNLSNFRASCHQQQQTAADKRRLICDELEEIRQLPENLRRSAIRRLYLKYHPDRNLDNPEEYERLFVFLKSQIVHLERNEPLDDPRREGNAQRSSSANRESTATTTTWSTQFENWNATASSHKRSRNSRQSSMYEEPFRTPFSQSQDNMDRRNPKEGKRWIRQAENEITVLRACLHQADDTKGYGHVCFLSHEVAEKALKGGLYALCGLDARKIDSHQLSNNAHALRTMSPDEACYLPQHCAPLEDHYLNTRFPNRRPESDNAPCDHYDMQDAEDAQKHAEEVLRIVKSIMPKD